MPVINGVSTTHDNLIPPLLKGFNTAWRYQTPLHKTIALDVSGMKGVRGEVIKANFSEDLHVQDVTPSAALPPGEDQQWYDKEVTLSEWKEVRFKFNDRVIADGTGTMAIQTAIRSAASALAKHLNDDILNELRVTGNILLTNNTPISSYADIIAFNKIMSMRTPTHDRILIFGRNAEAQLLSQPQFLEQNLHANAANIVQGVIGRRLGFDFMPMDVPTNTLKQEVPDTITLTGITTIKANRDTNCVAQFTTVPGAGKFLYPGNILEVIELNGTNIEAVAPQDQRLLTVAKKVEGNAASVPLEFRVGHDFAGNLLSNITSLTVKMIKIVDEGLGYSREAVSMVMRPSETLGFASSRASIYDQGNQIAMTLERQRGHKITFFNSDILYGMSHLMPGYSARQVQIDPANMYVV